MALDDGTFTIRAENAAEDDNDDLIDLEYEVKMVKRKPEPGTMPFSSLPAVSPENSFQFNLKGKSESLTLEFILYDDGTDRSNGSLSTSTISDSRFTNDTVTTVREQKIWLKEYIATFNLSVTWRLFGKDYTDRVNQGDGTPVVITEARPEPVSDRPTSMRFIVKMSVGRRVI